MERTQEPARSLTLTLMVGGLSDDAAVEQLHEALGDVQGVVGLSVDRATSSVKVEVDPALVTLDYLESAVAVAGLSLMDPASDQQGDASGGDFRFDDLRRRIITGSALAAPVLLVRALILTGVVRASTALGAVEAVLVVALLAFVGRGFFTRFIAKIRKRQGDIDLLVALSVGASLCASLLSIFAPELLSMKESGGAIYLDVCVLISTCVLAGRFVEAVAVQKGSAVIRRLEASTPVRARVLRGTDVEEVDVAALREGDHVQVKPGDRVPADGVIIEGEGTLDESMVTGESMLVSKHVGGNVIGGTVVMQGTIVSTVATLGNRSVLGQVIALARRSHAATGGMQDRVENVAAQCAPAVIVTAVTTFFGWWIFSGGDAGRALANVLALLAVCCPVAISLATPYLLLRADKHARMSGISYRNLKSIERAREITTMVFDKTGTITEGAPSVVEVLCAQGCDEASVFQRAGSLELKSQHPLALAVVDHARRLGVDLDRAEAFHVLPGLGVSAIVAGEPVVAGTALLMRHFAMEPGEYRDEDKRLAAEGKTPLYIGINGRIAAIVGFADRVRNTSAGVVKQLREMKIEPVLMTGDRHKTAQVIAAELGIKKCIGEVTPAEKVREIARLRKRDEVIALVGDGVYDARALAQADVSLVLKKEDASTMEAAHVTIGRADLQGVVRAVRLAGRIVSSLQITRRAMFGWSAIAMLVAVTGCMTPLIADAVVVVSLLLPLLVAGLTVRGDT